MDKIYTGKDIAITREALMQPHRLCYLVDAEKLYPLTLLHVKVILFIFPYAKIDDLKRKGVFTGIFVGILLGRSRKIYVISPTQI